MTNPYLGDALNLLRADTLSEEYRTEGLRSVLGIFQQALMHGIHTPQGRVGGNDERYCVSRIMSGGVETLEHALKSCSTDYAIRHVIHAYIQVLRKREQRDALSEKEKRIIHMKILCIASIGLILKQCGRMPEKGEPVYGTLERLLVASLSATSVFEKGISIPELGITFQV